MPDWTYEQAKAYAHNLYAQYEHIRYLKDILAKAEEAEKLLSTFQGDIEAHRATFTDLSTQIAAKRRDLEELQRSIATENEELEDLKALYAACFDAQQDQLKQLYAEGRAQVLMEIEAEHIRLGATLGDARRELAQTQEDCNNAKAEVRREYQELEAQRQLVENMRAEAHEIAAKFKGI